MTNPSLSDLVQLTGAWACHDCGACTAVCPIARAGDDYSPRRNVLGARGDWWDDVVAGDTLSHCLTCGRCDLRCPTGVQYVNLVQALRERAADAGVEPDCPHGGALQSIMRIMATGSLQQDRLGWLTDDLRTDPAVGEVFLWTGCTPYFDALFAELGVATLDGTRGAVRLLNALDIVPVVSPDERCCGHDLLWNGDRGHFEQLARHNADLIAASGARTVVTACAECARTLELDYAPFLGASAPHAANIGPRGDPASAPHAANIGPRGDPASAPHAANIGPRGDPATPPRIVHLTEYLAERLADLPLGASETQRVTYQDPCRLGRHLGVYDPPRQLLAALPGVELVEMGHAGPRATCCAGGTWSNCDRFAKQIQVERLREARRTGAEVLATACPKCQIHYRCAMKDPRLAGDITLPIRDVAALLAAALPAAAGPGAPATKEMDVSP
jgi:heterodisulfide reductase subunit D